MSSLGIGYLFSNIDQSPTLSPMLLSDQQGDHGALAPPPPRYASDLFKQVYGGNTLE